VNPHAEQDDVLVEFLDKEDAVAHNRLRNGNALVAP